MPNYVIFDKSTGHITRTLVVPVEIIAAQIQENEDYLLSNADVYDKIDIATKEVIKGIEPPLKNSDPNKDLPSYVRNRKVLYKTVTDQLDMLFKDVQDGLFGESAKQSKWFKHVDQIKNSVPKDGTDVPTIIYEAEEVV